MMFCDVKELRLQEDMRKFKPDFDGIDSEEITKWSQRYLNNELKAHLMSEELPDDWDKQPVKVSFSSNCARRPSSLLRSLSVRTSMR